MGSININYGNNISMGDNNIVSGNSIGGEVKDIQISQPDIHALKQLADKICTYRNTEVKSSEMMQAGLILANLAESAEENDKNKQHEYIVNWKQFKSKAAPKVIEAIHILSSSITIGTFLSSLLGS